MSIDQRFSRFLFERTKDSALLTKLAIFCGSFLIWLMLGLVIGLFGLTTGRGFEFLSLVFLAPVVIMPWLFTCFISKLVKRPRPFESEHYKPTIKLFVYTNSFPSAHATIAFALVAASRGDVSVCLFVLVGAMFVTVGRLAVGVHYVSDVIVGALIGFFGGLACQFALGSLLSYLFGN